MARYALIIGISQYEEPFEFLTKAATDAYAVKKILEKFGEYRVDVLVDGSSGGDNPLERLVKLAFHPVESSKNISLLTGLLRISFEPPCSR